MAEKYNKPFNNQYKDVKIISSILIFTSLSLLISAAASEWLNKVSPIILSLTTFVFIYTIFFFFLYWKCGRFIKKKSPIPRWFRIITAILFVFYLTFYKSNEKKYRWYLLLNEIRFWSFSIFCSVLFFLISFFIIDERLLLLIWVMITAIIFSGINLIISVIIWQYQGTNSKFLKFLAIICLSYRNYQLYKAIIKLNSNEK